MSKRNEVRFAVGQPHGVTSNSWKIWTHRRSVYIACRDNFQEAKVSLHPEGGWRMAFTTEATRKLQLLPYVPLKRDWHVWSEPPTTLPDTVVAFKLLFPTSELGVRPDQRQGWANVVYVEHAPPGKLVVVTLFITVGDKALKHESEPSERLASLDIDGNRRAQVIVHRDPEKDLPKIIEQDVARIRARVETKDGEAEVPSFARRMKCSKCGGRRVDVRPNWKEKAGMPDDWTGRPLT